MPNLKIKNENGEWIEVPVIKGTDGINGEDGYTPVKGQDYFTDQDVSDFIAHINSLNLYADKEEYLNYTLLNNADIDSLKTTTSEHTSQINTLDDEVQNLGIAMNRADREKNIISAGFSSDFTIATNGANRVPITRIYAQVGSKFTMGNGRITVGSGVNYVMVSGIGAGNSGAKVLAHAMNFYIYKNGTELVRAINSCKTATALNYPLTIPPKLIPVNEGDYFEIYFYGQTGDVLQCNERFTYITLEAVDEPIYTDGNEVSY